MSTKLQRISELEEDLREVIPTIKSVLPKHLTHERMIKLVVHATEKNPDLLRCSRASLKAALIEASELGLEPLGVTGQACLIAYGGSVQLMPMYKGLIKLARNSGQLIDIQSEAVFAKDTFDFSWKTEGNKILDVLEHKPFLLGDRGEITGGWARATLKNEACPSDPVVRQSYLDITKLKKIRAEASPKSKMWQLWPEEAVKKSCIKNMLKQLPQSVELSQAIDLDNRLETDGRYDRQSSVTVESVEIQEPRRKSESSPQEEEFDKRDPNITPPDCPDGHGEMICYPRDGLVKGWTKEEVLEDGTVVKKARKYPAFYRCLERECKKSFNYKKWVEANA
jgi:recombination protein RecT